MALASTGFRSCSTRGVDSGSALSSPPAKEVAFPGVASIVFGSSWEDGCGLGVPKLLLVRRFDGVESRSRLCLAFRFFPRSVVSDSNWVRFGPQSSPALVHRMHFCCVFSSHVLSDGLHYPPSDLRLWKGWGRQIWGLEPWRTYSLFVLHDDTDHIFSVL
jgi:hypothetical protein